MCTKKTIYSAGADGHLVLRARERGGKLNFAEISYATDCVREVASLLDMPMVKVIGELRAKGAFVHIYREARRKVRRPASVVAQEVLAM